MLEITTYQCEFCGKMFENDWDCIDHEDAHKRKDAEGHIEMWNDEGEPLPLDQTEQAFYVHIVDDIGRDYLEEQLNRGGYSTPAYDTGEGVGYFYYDGGSGDWHLANDILEQANKILSIFGKAEIPFIVD